jgi:hypothetical protein
VHAHSTHTHPRIHTHTHTTNTKTQCGQGITTYPWPAESIADFIKGRTFLAHGAIDRPSFIKSPVFPLFALALLGGGGYVAWVLYNSWIVRMTWIWCLGSLAIYGAQAQALLWGRGSRSRSRLLKGGHDFVLHQ